MTQPGPPGGEAPPGPAPAAGPEVPAAAPAGAPAADGAAPDTPPEPADDHALGSGSAAGEATSRPGQGSRRNEYLREAERLTVEGDAVARDKNVFLIGGKQRARLRVLSQRQVEPVRAAFVAPGSLADIQAACEKSRAVILRGPAGYGKQGLAIRMLIDLCQGQFFHLDRAVDLTRLAEWIETDLRGRNRIEHGAGFLLDKPLGFADLYGSVIQGLEDALEQADARLILTIDSDVQVPERDLLDYVVDITSAPSYSDIVARHIDFRLGNGMADVLMARAGAPEEIARQLADGASCKLAAELAEAIASECDMTGDEFEFDFSKLGDWKSRRGTENFDIWFAGLDGTRSRTFAVALAVLNGLPYDAVSRGARALHRRFDQPARLVMAPAGDVRPEEPQAFRIPRREWLHKLQAQVRETEVQGDYGPSPAEVVEYRIPGYVTKVLRRAWSDYEAQDILVSWLGELAEDPSAQVRIFAGLALGLLATWSFDSMSSTVLAPWAAGGNRARHEAVAYALRVLAADPRRRDNVTRLVSGWHASGQPEAQATAARAYGVAYGVFDPVAAFAALDRLTTVGDIRVATAIGDSIADLLAAGSDDLIGRVLTSLAGAVRDADRTGAVQLIFLILADGLLSTVDGATGAAPVSWPFLLHLTTRLAPVRPAIVTLWQYVLNEALFHEEAEQVMTRWAGAAESEPGVREAFLRLARAIAGHDQRTLTILRRYCAHWASTDNFRPLPEVSAALQTVLSTSTEAR